MKKQTDNGNRYALTTLKNQRGRLAGEIAHLKIRLRWLEEHLVHVDATIHLLSPSTDTGSLPKVRPQMRIRLFRQGELGRLLVDTLRRAGKPLQTKEIVSAVITAGSHDDSARAALRPRVQANLHYLYTQGRITKLGRGNGVLWALRLQDI